MRTDEEGYDKPSIRPCECCGQLRPYPTEPDEVWEFIGMVELRRHGSDAKWTQIRTVRGYEYDNPVLWIIPTNPEEYFEQDLKEMGDDPDLRIWWPSNVMWRKVDGISTIHR